MQRQIRHALQRLDGFAEDFWFIEFGKPDVDVEDFGARLLLGNPFPQHIPHVALAQRLLQALFAGRVDALPNQDRPPAKEDGVAVRGDRRFR